MAKEEVASKELALLVPTYNGGLYTKGERPEFSPAETPVLIREDTGIRVVLGSHDFTADVPDVQIERRPHGWVIFIHPRGSFDACGCFYIHDDERTFYQPADYYRGSVPETVIVSPTGKVPDFDYEEKDEA